MKKIFFLSFLLAASLVSCRQAVIDNPVTTGSLSLKVGSLTDYMTVETKADGDAVDFTNTADYDVVIDGPTKLEMKFSEFSGNVIELGSGDYTIIVTSPLTEPAAFEQPIYRAYETFTITAGEVTALDLVCTPYNCKVTIELSENFKKELATYEVVIGNGLGELTWTKDDIKDDFGENKAGYFLPRGLEVKVKGHRSIDDTEATAVYYVKNPQPAEHHIIRLDAKVTGQIGGISINVVTEFNEVENDIEIPGMDESYVDRPDFNEGEEGEGEGESTSPSIEWLANPYFDPITIQKGDEISLTIKAPLGLKTFRVDVSDNFKAAVSMITGSADKAYIDLVNDAAVWEPFNLPVGDEVVGQTEIVFELTPFIDTLCGAAAGLEVQFILVASDANDEYILLDGEYPVVIINVPAA